MNERGTDDTDVRTASKGQEHVFECIAWHRVVRIDDQEEFAFDECQSGIIAASVSRIIAFFDDAYAGGILVPRSNPSDRFVVGMIVDDDNFKLRCDCLCSERFDTSNCIAWRAVVEDKSRNKL